MQARNPNRGTCIYHTNRQAVMCVKFKTVRDRLVLLWSFLTYFGYHFSVFSSIYLLTNILTLLQNTDWSNRVFVAPLFLFIPLAGWIGDVKRGRYKTLKGSLLFLTIMSLIPIAVSCVNLKHPALFTHSGAKVVAIVPLFFLVVVSISGFVSFAANAIPFAMDQLRDAPAQDSSVFISWYVWTLFSSLLANLSCKIWPWQKVAPRTIFCRKIWPPRPILAAKSGPPLQNLAHPPNCSLLTLTIHFWANMP